MVFETEEGWSHRIHILIRPHMAFDDFFFLYIRPPVRDEYLCRRTKQHLHTKILNSQNDLFENNASSHFPIRKDKFVFKRRCDN